MVTPRYCSSAEHVLCSRLSAVGMVLTVVSACLSTRSVHALLLRGSLPGCEPFFLPSRRKGPLMGEGWSVWGVSCSRFAASESTVASGKV